MYILNLKERYSAYNMAQVLKERERVYNIYTLAQKCKTAYNMAQVYKYHTTFSIFQKMGG